MDTLDARQNRLYRRLLNYVRPYWGLIFLSFLANAAYSAIDSGFIYSLKPILDKAFIQKDVHLTLWLPILILIAFFFRGSANVAANYTITYTARSVVMRFRRAIFKHLLRLPANYYDQHTSGGILSTIIFNVTQLSNASANAVTIMAQSGFLVLGCLAVMFLISWKLSLIYLIIAPLVAVTLRYTSKRSRHLGHGVQDVMAEVSNISEEAIEGYKVIRAFGGQDYEDNKFQHATKRHRTREVKMALVRAVSVSSVQIIAGIAIALIIYLALSHYIDLSAGSFVALVAAMLSLLKPLKNMTRVNSTIQQGLAAAESIFTLLDEPLEKDTGSKPLDRAVGKIEYQDVTFSYKNAQKKALSAVNFTVQPGQMVALVGRSGGGKSTLVSLLSRFYTLDSGAIKVDDVNICDYHLADFRKQFALVSQQVVLFNDTIARNIAYGQLDTLTEDKIIDAAKAAHAWEFIKDLPDGFQTVVGENGVLLSGGQRQRIAIARAILKDAPILVLDEATAALDVESERIIQDALKTLMENRTSLVIAHRLSTIEKADLILVMEDGCIVESGTHAKLLEKNKHYANLYHMQFRHNEK